MQIFNIDNIRVVKRFLCYNFTKEGGINYDEILSKGC